MTNESAFFESWINVEHEVLGKQLRPLSIFHLLWLYQFNSPLVITSEEATIEDLEIAVAICSSSSNAEILKALNSKEFNLWQRITNYFWRRANRRKRSLKDELRKFIAYNDDYVAIPKLFPKDSKDSNNAFPGLLLNAAALIKNTGWSEEVVFSMPIGKIMWFNLSFSFLATGETNVMSERDIQAAEAIKALYKGKEESLTAGN